MLARRPLLARVPGRGLVSLLSPIPTTPRVGEVYVHYTGRSYQVVALARDSDTCDWSVVYRAMYDSPIFGPKAVWTRPRNEWVAKVKHEGKWVDRFTHVPVMV